MCYSEENPKHAKRIIASSSTHDTRSTLQKGKKKKALDQDSQNMFPLKLDAKERTPRLGQYNEAKKLGHQNRKKELEKM